MKTPFFSNGLKRARQRSVAASLLLPLLAGAPLACSDEDSTRVGGGGLQPGGGSSGDADGTEQGGSAGDDQSGANGGSSGEGTGGSNLSSNGGSAGDGAGGSSAAPECVSFDNAERVPLYDGTTLPPLN